MAANYGVIIEGTADMSSFSLGARFWCLGNFRNLRYKKTLCIYETIDSFFIKMTSLMILLQFQPPCYLVTDKRT